MGEHVKKFLIVAAVAAIAVLSAYASLRPAYLAEKERMASEAADKAAARLEMGKQLYQEFCAVCHGANLEGAENWQTPLEDGSLPPPPHDETGHTWHHGDQLLFDYTKFGGAAMLAQMGVEMKSGMPAFEGQLTDDEIRAILDYIKSTWPQRIRDLQAERTAFENENQ
jgi:mono/diheme cytochrome c family protein